VIFCTLQHCFVLNTSANYIEQIYNTSGGATWS